MPSVLLPWRHEIDRLKREMHQLCERLFDLGPLPRFDRDPDWFPAVDLTESASVITVYAEIPGVEAEDIDVSLEGNVLTIRGQRKRESMQKDEEVRRPERSYGAFLRSIRLPAEVDPDETKASYSDGVLEVRMPKVNKEGARKIPISME